MAKIILCSSFLKPQMIDVPSSKNPNITYTTIAKTIFSDSVCTCPGFQYRGECRHVAEVDAQVCTYHKPYEVYHGSTCPECGSPIVTFEMEPEFD